MPASTVTGDVIERVTATMPASTPLRAKMTARTTAGLMPHSSAPVSSWITERTARPNVVKRRNSTSTTPMAKLIADATRLPGAHAHAEHVDRVAADAQARALRSGSATSSSPR